MITLSCDSQVAIMALAAEIRKSIKEDGITLLERKKQSDQLAVQMYLVKGVI